MERLICLLIGYFFGMFQTSYIYGKLQGIDIREYGSGNAGTTNALRTLGQKAGAVTLLGDCLKCILAVAVVRFLYGNSHQDIIQLLSFYASAGTILGHNFPFYLRFHGGKGIAATAGMIIAFDWRLTLIEAVVFFGVFFATHYVSLGSLLVYVVLVIAIVVMGQTELLEIPAGNRMELYLLVLALAVLAFWQHRSNISKLLHKTERKTYLSKKHKKETQNS